MKHYRDENVYQAALCRIRMIFDRFERIFVAFSGGKDSGVLLHLAAAEARRRRRKIGVLFIDLEAFYRLTIEFVERCLAEYADVLEPEWVCLPMESPNSTSYLEPTWVWWEPARESLWVRPMPKHPSVRHLGNHSYPFYRCGMTFESFVREYAEWYGGMEPAACLVGLRTDESLNRYRALTCDKETFEGWRFSTRNGGNSFNFYPLYDWRTEDIWTYNGKFHKDYNHLYDLFFQAGVKLSKMRVDEPFGNESKAGLNLFRVIEPDTWARVVNRVSGANFGNMYSGTRLTGANYRLPQNHSWKSFTKFLLHTLPEPTARHYRERFVKFIRYWHRKGCPLQEKQIEILNCNYADIMENTHRFSRRGAGDKEVVRFRRIADEIPELDGVKDVLSWKRMAMCIIKNDFYCKSLSFAVTARQSLRQKEILEKYRNL